MNEVFLVTRGGYSDHQTVAVFSGQKRASAYAEALGDARVEKYQMNVPTREWWQIEVTMARDSTVIYSSDPDVDQDHLGGTNYGFKRFDHDSNMVYLVQTDDPKRAVNETDEARSRILALNFWPDDLQFSRERLMAQERVRLALSPPPLTVAP